MRKQRNIELTGVRQNNLKNFDTHFPEKKLSVITGVSGSGKSSLAFETLYAEGQRRYIESLSTYTRQFLEKMPKPDVEAVLNIPPSIALEQRNHVVHSRSTLGTQTEILDYLRVLFSKCGKTFCLKCGKNVIKVDSESILTEAMIWFPGKTGAIAAPFEAQVTGKKLWDLLGLYKEQGYRRILVKKSSKKYEILNLEDLEAPEDLADPTGTKKTFSIKPSFVIVDRLKLKSTPSESDKNRVADSIDQALGLGRDRLSFIDLDTWKHKDFETRFSCQSCGEKHEIPEPNLFSFNSPLGACSDCSGFGHTLEFDERLVVPDPTRTLKDGAIDPLAKPSTEDWQEEMFRFAERHGISIRKKYSELTPSERKLLWNGHPKDKTFQGILKCFESLAKKKYKLHVRVFIRRYQSQQLCETCHGARLNQKALAVKICDKTIANLTSLSISNALKWFNTLKLPKQDAKQSIELLFQLGRRLSFLETVGVGYLALDRQTKTLSGGEFQRINLATQLGNGLCGTLYVLDEPSIGLHPSDTARLIKILENLRDQGNTVVVVEHDLEVMKAADWLVELGPGAGKRGGNLVAEGTASSLKKQTDSITGQYLAGTRAIRRTRPIRSLSTRKIKITGCREHCLKNLTVEFPLERFVVITGVSGSGKSTLVHKTLYHALKGTSETSLEAGRFDKLYGAEQIGDVVLLDQKPIGKSSRSNPATYMKIWDEVRKIYANQVLSLRRGYTPQYFSFNVEGGRCPVCKGEGEIAIDMHFMAEINLPCEECEGRRFKKNILDVNYRNKNVSELLNTTIDEAFDIFRDNSVVARKLGLLREVGLGYLQLGQSATTLSGGESQRLKIASVLDDNSAARSPRKKPSFRNQHLSTLYIFDEPTTGLHQEDISKLLEVIHDLVDTKNSVLMIEHHLDLIAQADWIIDLGPGGGELGGKLLASGPPSEVAMTKKSTTGKELMRAGYQFDPPIREKPFDLRL